MRRCLSITGTFQKPYWKYCLNAPENVPRGT